MALRSIRYGSGVWKQHEEQRVRLEARVCELEVQLAHLQLRLDDDQQTQTQLQSTLDASERRALELEQLLQLLTQENAFVSAERTAVTERLAASVQRIEQLDRDLAAAQCDRERQAALLADAAAYTERLELQVDASREEEMRLCELLYATQEKCEAHEVELARCQREVRILSRANHVMTRQSDALAKDKHALAQQLARMRSANPIARTVAAATPGTPLRKCSAASTLQLQPVVHVHTASSVAAATNSAHNDDVDDDDAQASSYRHVRDATIAPTAVRCSSSSSDASFVWKQLQFASAKLQREQQTTAQLRERIAALEASEYALIVRFREASAARKHAEQKQKQQQKQQQQKQQQQQQKQQQQQQKQQQQQQKQQQQQCPVAKPA